MLSFKYVVPRLSVLLLYSVLLKKLNLDFFFQNRTELEDKKLFVDMAHTVIQEES